MSKPFNAETSVGYLIAEVAKAFRRRFEEIAKRHDLTLPQAKVLSELARKGGVSQTVLAGAIDADPMTLKGIVDRLEKRSLVLREQDPSDSRAKIVQLTDEGRTLFGAVKEVGSEIHDLAIDGLSQDEQDLLAAGLTKIRNNLSRAAAAQKEVV